MQRRQGLGDEEVETNSVEDNNKQSAIIQILYPINKTKLGQNHKFVVIMSILVNIIPLAWSLLSSPSVAVISRDTRLLGRVESRVLEC